VNDDIDLLVLAVRLIVLDVDVLARFHRDRVDSEGAHAEELVEGLPASSRGCSFGHI